METVLKEKVYPEKGFFDKHVVVFTLEDYEQIVNQYYTEAYTFKTFEIFPPEGAWSIMFTPYAYLILIVALIFVFLILKGIDRLINSILPKSWRQIPLLLVIGAVTYRLILGGVAAFFFSESPTMAFIVSILPYVLTLAVYLVFRLWYEKQSFGLRQALLVLLILVIGPLIQSIIWYLGSQMYAGQVNEIYRDHFASTFSSYILSNNAYIFVACGLFLTNLILEFFKLT